MNTKPRYRFFWISVHSLLLAGTTLFLISVWRALGIESPLHVEGVVLGFMEMIREGRIYQADALVNMPFSLLTHPPLSYGVGYWFSLLDPGKYWPLRLLTSLSTAGISLLLFVWQWKQWRALSPAILSAGFFLLLPPIVYWGRLARCPDQFQVIFTLLAFSCHRTQVRDEYSTRWNSFLLGVFAFLAVYSKQTALPILWGTLIIDRVLRRDFRGFVYEFLSFSLLSGTGFLLLESYSNGGFHQNIFAHLMLHGYRWHWLKDVLVNQMGSVWLFLLIPVLSASSIPRFPKIYLWVSLIIGLITVTKQGSSAAHFIPMFSALCLVLGDALHVQHSCLNWRSAQLWAAGLLLVFMAESIRENTRLIPPPQDSDYENFRAFLAERNVPVLSDDAALILQLNQPLYWDDPFMLKIFLMKNEKMRALVKEGYFRILALRPNSQSLPDRVAYLTQRHFSFSRSFGPYRIYEYTNEMHSNSTSKVEFRVDRREPSGEEASPRCRLTREAPIRIDARPP